MSLELGKGIGQDDADMILDDAVLPVYIVTMFFCSLRYLRLLLKFLGLKCKVLVFQLHFQKMRRTCTERRDG